MLDRQAVGVARLVSQTAETSQRHQGRQNSKPHVVRGGKAKVQMLTAHGAFPASVSAEVDSPRAP